MGDVRLTRSAVRRVAATGVGALVALGLVATGAVSAEAATRPLPDGSYGLSSYYGPRCMPVKGASTSHLGQDMGARKGVDVRAVAKGRVIHAGATSGFGQYVVIRHSVDGRKIFSVYGHVIDGNRYVKRGDWVSRGKHIADVGSSGTSTSPHLHLEIWRGAYWGSGTTRDPLTWMRDHGASLRAGAAWANTRSVPKSCTYFTTTRVNLRSGPSTDYRVIKTVRVNRKLTAKPGASSGVWRKVNRDGVVGWMHADYVSPSYTSLGTRYVQVNGLRLRAEPNTHSTIRASLSKGTRLMKLWPAKNGWVRVAVGGKAGYVATRYIDDRRP